MSRWLSLLTLGAVILGEFHAAAAQTAVQLDVEASYTDNLFQNYTRRSDRVTLAYFDLNYVPRPRLNLYYSGNASVFANYQDLFSHNHQIGSDYTWSSPGGNQVAAGAAAGLRLDRLAYQYQDYVQGNAYLTAKVYLRPRCVSRAGYQVRYRGYGKVKGYSFAEQVAFAQLSQTLQTRTTLQVQGEMGMKTYVRTAAEGSESFGAIRGSGEDNLVQMVARFKVAQSLRERMGLQLEYLLRKNLTGRNRYVRVETYNSDDELFDDRYSYAGDEFRVTLKHLAWGLQAEMTGQYAQRRYEKRPALDLNGFLIGPAVMRQDTRKGLTVNAERKFRLSGAVIQEVRLQVEWLYTDVNSNDPYYQAVTQVYSTGLQIGF